MSLPIYHHPSTTVLIDDSANFLSSLSFQLDPRLPRKAFHDAVSAVEWVRTHSDRTAPIEELISAGFDSYPRTQHRDNVAYDFNQIYQISFEPQRFTTPSVIVVDYSMPQMNGLELCEALKDLPCKKILLTGTADETVAVRAFNHGQIDRYIRKSDDDALETLEAQILDLQRAFFAAKSEGLSGIFALHDYGFVLDPAIAALVKEISERFDIVEHYLFTSPTGFLLYDCEAKPRLLIIENGQSMNSHYEVAQDNGAPPSLLTALKEYRIIPNFSAGDGMYSAVFGEKWHKHCAPAQICYGREPYFWALFELAPDALPGAAMPFMQFLRARQ